MAEIQIPSFETERLLSKGVTEAAAPAWQKKFNDYEIIKNLSDAVPWPYPEDGAISFIKNVVLPNQGITRWVWGIYLKENPDDLIGVVDLWREGTPENRGFWLATEHWGKGFMTEVVKPINDYAFNELGFNSLIFSNAMGNTKSRRVKEKTGASFLRIEPAGFVNPQYTKAEIWELTKENWLKLKKA